MHNHVAIGRYHYHVTSLWVDAADDRAVPVTFAKVEDVHVEAVKVHRVTKFDVSEMV